MSAGLAATAQAAHEGMNLQARQTAVMTRLLSLSSRDDAGSDGLSSSLSSLSLNASTGAGGGDSSSWKVLVYDRYCQDILSPLLTVAELRRLGITLHMSLLAPRERVPDVPAIYLVRPTAENVALIARDVRKGLYDSTHLNFSTSIPRALLEQLAQAIVTQTDAPVPTPGRPAAAAAPLASGAAAASRIVRVLDQYTEFISLEERLFTLNAADSFPRLHGNHSTPSDEAAMFAHVDSMVESLFCVVVTMGVVPIIRARAGHAAEMVAKKLEARLREHLASRSNLFATSANLSSLSFHRPLLVIVDRTFDLAAPLLHSWTYQALLHDLLAMHSNRVTVTVPDAAPGASSSSSSASAAPAKPASSKPKTYDLLSTEDKFWKHNAGKPFPKVAEAVQERLDDYQKQFALVTRKAGGANAGPQDATSSGMDEIASAISSLPKLQRRKKLLDTHMTIATALLREIKSREIDVFYDVESNLLQRQPPDAKMVASIFGGPSQPEAPQGKGNMLDKLRFLLIMMLQQSPAMGEEQVQQYRALLASVAQAQASGGGAGGAAAVGAAGAVAPAQASALLPELGALDYVQHFKFLNRLNAGDDFHASAPASSKSAAGGSSGSGSTSAGVGGMLGQFGKLADSLYGGGVGLLAGVRNLLPSNNHLPLTSLVEALMANRSSGGAADATDSYLYFDPKAARAGGRTQRVTGAFKEAVVFVLGGGTYNEYLNLQEWQREAQASHGVQSVVYGCSELVSPEQFVRQLAALHHQAQQATRANVPVD